MKFHYLFIVQFLLILQEHKLMLWIVITALSTVLLLTLLFGFILRKRQKRQGKRSDGETQTTGSEEYFVADSTVDDEDIMVSQSIKELIETEQIFRDPELSPDLLAERMGISRKMVIKAINRMQKKSFAQFINELRIQEAILVLSNPAYIDLNYDEIAIDCGFYDKKTFLKAFKKETGVSAVDFKKNKLEGFL